MNASLFGLLMYAVSLATMFGIYGVLCIGLNVQWGFAGLFNAGIAGFFAVGAYATAILTSPESADYLGGFGWPPVLALPVAMLFSGLIAWPVGRICLRLQGDYLAMATIGISEIIRLVLKNEDWLANGTMGISTVPRPFESLGQPYGNLLFLAFVLGVLVLLYVAAERAWLSPWGRVLRAIRDNEMAAAAIGKDVVSFRLQAFVLGAMVMGLGGALSGMYFKFIGSSATEPLLTTFLVWVMLIIGGSGNNRGALLGAAIVWFIWSATELLTNRLPAEWITRSSYLRALLIGVLLIIVLQRFARGILPERPPRDRA
ncbi:branched-chain amino acid ABC transporter permease [Dongia sp.]|uniref:branched-chain amino acid ABC transporter permease n=1 Tax=Dongia sp. TaxID=1977262 RepID=UPI0035AF7E3D